MRNLFTGFAVGSALLLAATSEAITFTDFESIDSNLIATGPVSSYAGVFNIVDDGFVPGLHSVWSANVTFNIGEGQALQSSSFLIDLDGILNSSQFTSFLVLGTDQVGINLLTSLNQDGILNYNISATSGSFWLASASLSAEATIGQDDTARVPDTGSTFLLAGVALSSLALFRLRKFKQA